MAIRYDSYEGEGTMFEDVNAKCPYFRRVEKNLLIRCEGLDKTNNLILAFSKYNRLSKYRYNFCDSECWKGCPVAMMLSENMKD